ncbi:NAD(P)/FAD-dependent oxidoreductase, partial [Fusobacterium gastrosuis]|uniref:NAD(P)/FAD-dependent oxidoreductase n=1 Tax=Fusobacterium gastrosuis TaxID=1755100 RepID=UPI002A96BCE8|nr:NAD(P)/FAD-dependent oxidoreductase [Fusobacterium gastrosuis]
MIDVAVIGTGIMGAAVARELSKYELNILILDKDNDVSCGTTKANSAIVHAGYDAKEGSLMAKYNVAGNAMYEELCKEVDAPFRKVGSYVLAFSEKEREHLELLYKRGLSNGVPELEIIEAEEIQKREPHVSKEAVAALYAGTAGITGPWELAIKLVENAMENGAELKLNAEVVNIEKVGEYFKLTLKNGEIIETKTVINAAGVYADILNNMISKKTFKITPRIGEYYLLDKVQGYLTDSVIFQCPTEMGKGILVAKTAHGNIIAGPTASDVDSREYVGNTQEGLDTIKQFAVKSIKDINFRDNIRNFSGLRAEADTGDFILGEAEDVKGFFNMAGTKSPGLTSAPAMAVDLAEMVVKSLGNINKKENFIKNKKHIYFIELSPEEKA